MRVLLIADDLTGALDASVAFAERGMTVLCACTPEAAGAAVARGPDVVAVSTNSRELTGTEAARRLAAVLAAAVLPPATILFKKIDSRLKGHIAAEMEVLAACRDRALVCPAVPRLGRVVRDGAVCGAGIATPIPVAAKVSGMPFAAPDARDQADLDAAVREADPATLFVGAAGLAEALARRLAPTAAEGGPPRIGRPALFAIGSQDPVTLAQLDGFDAVAAPGGVLPSPPTDGPSLRLVRIAPGGAPVPAGTAARNFATGLRNWLVARRPATLLSCGGETTAAILDAIGCTMLEVRAEVLPGLPLSRMVDGMPGLALVTKSGGFGAPDTLREVARRLSD
ncbi:four-carbon acid sugar kinase family protein [Oceaniglobus roseus]|uniref:four-carbon acid sugar kinase family protein n=1 Tax=Oceaniglobus roseus TaxID=1737570 RepID=UPI001562602C|nr:four-carbon acid sugar kinase family protein [Kandeliimicrobium roseum]